MAIGRPISLTPNIATKNISSIATADQTEFTVTGGYRINEIAVYRNGVRLAEGRDFTASDGDTVNLVNGATVDDVIEFAVFDSFNIADAIIGAASSQTVNGDLNVTGIFYAGDFKPTNLVVGVSTINSSFHVGSAFTANAAGDVETIGIITAASFSGDGSALTGVASTDNIITGTAATFGPYAGVSAGVPNVNIAGLATVGIITAYGASEFTSTLTVGGAGNFTSSIHVSGTTDSTSTGTGALKIDGGLGVAKNVYIGAGLSVAGTLTYEDVTNVDSVGLITAKSGVNVTGGQLTVGSGITIGIAGIVTSQGFRLADNKQIKFGTGDDSGMYYTGSHLYIDNNTAGDTYLRSTNINIQTNSASSSENAIVATANEDVSLYYNGSKKFETTNDGTVTTGIATATAGVDITGGVLGLRLGTGSTVFSPGSNILALGTNDKERLRVQSDGSINIETALGTANEPLVEIYNKDGNVMTGQCLKLRSGRGSGVIDTAIFAIHDSSDNEFFRVDNGGSVGIGTTACLNPLHVHGPSSGVGPIIQLTNDTGDCRLFFGANSTAGSANAQGQMRYNVGTNLMQFYTGGSSRFLIGSTGISTFSTTPYDDKGNLRSVPRLSKSSAYVLIASDAGKCITITTGGVTINPSVMSEGDVVTIINDSGSNQTITQGSSMTLYDTGDDGSTGNKTLKGRGMCTVWFTSHNNAYVTGNFD